VYTAEFSAASNSRMNCISTIVSCVQKTCGSQWDENSDNYDACLSDPDLVIKNTCSLEAARCGDSGSSTSVMNYVRAKLAAIRVDKCTQEVKDCLLSEDRCGPDYAGCIGLDTDTIVDLCPNDKLIACQTKYDPDTVRDYVAKVAQGLALNIDNSFATQCQNAADAAMERVCGTDEEDEDCPGLILSNSEIKNSLKWQFCRVGGTDCSDELSYMNDSRIKRGVVEPRLNGKLDLTLIAFDESGKGGTNQENVTGEYFYIKSASTRQAKDGYSDTDNTVLNMVIGSMNRDYLSTIDQVEADPTIDACINGKSFQTISASDGTRKNVEKVPRFSNLMHTTHVSVSNKMLSSILTNYNNELASMIDSGKRDTMYEEIMNRYEKIIMKELASKDPCDMTAEEFAQFSSNDKFTEQMENQQDIQNDADCTTREEWNQNADFNTNGALWSWLRNLFGTTTAGIDKLVTYGTKGEYDPETNTCIVTVKEYQCKKTRVLNKSVCKEWDTANPTVTQQKHAMPKYVPGTQASLCN
jgi:hypothetical protein